MKALSGPAARPPHSYVLYNVVKKVRVVEFAGASRPGRSGGDGTMQADVPGRTKVTVQTAAEGGRDAAFI